MTLDLLKILILGAYNIFQSEGLFYDSLIHSFEKINLYILPAAVLVALFGFFEVLRGPVTKKVSVKRDNVKKLDQLKIAQISDLHIGLSIRTKYVNKVIQKTNALNPDIIVVTGDLIDGEPQSILHVTRLLSKLKAKHGVYYVVGNHEYYWGIDSVLKSLEHAGMQILLNENKVIDIEDTIFMIAGITDPAANSIHPSMSPDLAKASRGIESVDFKILLAHQPSIYPHAEKLKFDLQLSGHTHAGQFFPFSLFIVFAHKYSRGLYQYNDMHVHINPGTGYWGPANRFGVPAEITLIELKQK